jgi:hypothetical protein
MGDEYDSNLQGGYQTTCSMDAVIEPERVESYYEGPDYCTNPTMNDAIEENSARDADHPSIFDIRGYLFSCAASTAIIKWLRSYYWPWVQTSDAAMVIVETS